MPMPHPEVNQCRWIHGDLKAGTARWCSVTAIPGRAWCEEHRSVVYSSDDADEPKAAPYEPRTAPCKSNAPATGTNPSASAMTKLHPVAAAHASRKARFSNRAQAIAPIVREVIRRLGGRASWSAIARDLNANGIRTEKGALWHGHTIKRLFDQAETAE